jgi:hypothetical protein
MRKVVFAFVVVFLCSTLTAFAQSGLELHLEAYDRGEGQFFMLMLVNNGPEEVTILTDELEKGISKGAMGANKVDATFGIGRTTATWKGKKIISSLPAYKPVTLKRNEAARLNIVSRFGNEIRSPFRKMPDNGEITISYEVTGEWGERFDIWEGKVSTATYPIKAGNIITPNMKK